MRHEWEFQSTRPVRGATPAEVYCTFSYTISIHAPRAGRDAGRDVVRPGEHISIHAPRAGRDKGLSAQVKELKISIHAPRAGRDPDRG